MSGFGLEEIGIPGGVYLKESLTHCTDPLKAIEEFQVRGEVAFCCLNMNDLCISIWVLLYNLDNCYFSLSLFLLLLLLLFFQT